MLPSYFSSIALFASIGFAASVHAWSQIRRDEAAWQSDCENSDRAGAVCIDAKYGNQGLYKVQEKAHQNVAFSEAGNSKFLIFILELPRHTETNFSPTTDLVAYCPNLSKGEKPYSLQYGSENTAAYLNIQGRPSSQRCCYIQYTASEHGVVINDCLEPTVGAHYRFPAPAVNGID